MSILHDKVVLVTGAGRGSAARPRWRWPRPALWWRLPISTLPPPSGTAEQAAGNARRALAIEADCGDVKSIAAMVARTVAELGRLDVIVNNAGVTHYAQIMDLTEADWDRIHRVNAKGVFFLSAARRPRDDPAKFKLTGAAAGSSTSPRSPDAVIPAASNAAYAASKGRVISLTWMAAQSSSAATTSTSMRFARGDAPPSSERATPWRGQPSAASPVAELHAEAGSEHPDPRANTPEDIAAMAVFLASPGGAQTSPDRPTTSMAAGAELSVGPPARAYREEEPLSALQGGRGRGPLPSNGG